MDFTPDALADWWEARNEGTHAEVHCTIRGTSYLVSALYRAEEMDDSYELYTN